MERPIIYDTKDLQEILKCGKNKAYALMRSKCFPSMRLNAKYIVTHDNLVEWLDKNSGKWVTV